MLFGQFMDLKKEDDLLIPKTPFKRYWNAEIWKPLFVDLLNHGETFSIEHHIGVIEDYLESTPGKAQELRTSIVQQRSKLHLLHSQAHH